MRKIGFALEYALGHVTHAENLKRALPAQIEPRYVEIPFDKPLPGSLGKIPGVRSNWTLRASLLAHLGLQRAGTLDGLFYHTQIATLFAAGRLAKTPGIVSLDATPVQMDALGAAYGHFAGSRRTEALKKRLLQRTLGAAAKIVTWSQWTKDSLIADYGQPEEKIVVIPPGVAMHYPLAPDNGGISPHYWGLRGNPVRLLFVGADFARKGGEELLAAWSALPERLRAISTLDIVTKSEFSCELSGVCVHRGLSANSPELKALFCAADVFVFPTRADCLPLAVLEAAAAGLPVISTTVGAIPEAVIHGETGLLVSPNDVSGLTDALTRLLENPAERVRMGESGRALACERFDAAKNYRRLVELFP